MQQFDHHLAYELERMRHADIHAELERERFLAEHGLDLWSVVRRSLGGWLRRAPARGEQRHAVSAAVAEEQAARIAA